MGIKLAIALLALVLLSGCEAVLSGAAAIPVGIHDDAAARQSAKDYRP